MSSLPAPAHLPARTEIALHRPEGEGAEFGQAPGKLATALRALAAYAGVALASLAVAGFVFQVWRAEPGVPFTYGGDGAFYLSLIKGIRDNGWYLHNPSLGAPVGLDMHDFPLADSGHFLLIKLILKVCPDAAVAFNCFVLLAFPLTALSALFVLRRFGLSWAPALAASLLYTSLPFHFFRGPHHIFLAAYYVVPLSVWAALRVFPGDWSNERPDRRWGPFRPGEWLLLAAVCALTGTAGVYYALFACFFIAVAGVAAALAHQRKAPLVCAGMLICVTGASLAATLSPTLIYRRQHGMNRQAVIRVPIEGELYGLKVTQMLLPITGHRVPWLARQKQRYNASAPLFNENDHASLGLVAGCGFIGLVGIFLFRRRGSASPSLVDGLGLFNLSAVLVATIGGFGCFAGLVVPLWIRGYNRMCVFIGFFALFAVAMLLDAALRRWGTGRARAGWLAATALLVGLGLFDQSTPNMAPAHEQLARDFRADETYVRRLEAALPSGAMVFQYPYVEFVEHPPLAAMMPYDMLRPYLHSHSLRWSYGAMRGRDCAAWQKAVAALPPAEMVRHLRQAGFAAVYVDRAALPDRGAAFEAGLANFAEAPPVVSEGGRYAVYGLAARLGEKHAASQRTGHPQG